MSFPLSVLIISGEPEHRHELAAAVMGFGVQAVCCDTFDAASGVHDLEQFAVAFWVLAEGDLPSEIGAAAHSDAQIPIVVVSRRDDWDSYLGAMSAGAFDYVAIPVQPSEVERVLQAALSVSAFTQTVA
jgi:DNA-binding NtrC family response regulator